MTVETPVAVPVPEETPIVKSTDAEEEKEAKCNKISISSMLNDQSSPSISHSSVSNHEVDLTEYSEA